MPRVARGLAALEFGANANGGVINVVKNQISTTIPNHIAGSVTLNGETVNTGISGAVNLKIPINNYVLNLALNGRYATNTNTRAYEIQKSFFETTNNAAGLS